ncbi:SPOR domain-containing protein [Nitratiruptor sp. YY09-18]|uniref:SPOR domain-containing protein n=1 Tax=Nitratiruptor sp. YY09-18 TaxID=2724901 RepID=UPI0019168607|nr:SPOR domain-containing protein [Nitratiruptor sp. YY09-18]BCD67820.1 DedD protein [Nitratiruptor sp. YY09-18]
MDKENLQETFEDLEELHHNELDDIVLENYDKKDKIKRYAIIGALVISIFIVVISIVKMVTESSSAPQEKLVATQAIEENSEQEENFEEVPITNESSKVTNEESQSNQEEVDRVLNEIMETEKSKNKPTKVNQQSATHQTKPAAPKPQPEQKIAKPKEAKKGAAKRVAKPATPKPQPKPVHKSGNYYIQVGAFMMYDPDKAFLAKIKRIGFTYIIKEFTIKGKKVKRVYVGPFSSRSEAARYLPKVRKNIARGAFIAKVTR